MKKEESQSSLNIEFSGFRDIDESSMNIIKKVVDNHARRISELTKKIELIKITLKPIHEREKSEKYEIHAILSDNGKVYASETIGRNLLSSVDEALNKLINELS